MELGIDLKVNGVTYKPVVTVSIDMSGNGTVVELGVEVEIEAVREKLLIKCRSEVSAFHLGGFQGLSCGAVFAEARMSAELLCGMQGVEISDERRALPGNNLVCTGLDYLG